MTLNEIKKQLNYASETKKLFCITYQKGKSTDKAYYDNLKGFGYNGVCKKPYLYMIMEDGRCNKKFDKDKITNIEFFDCTYEELMGWNND